MKKIAYRERDIANLRTSWRHSGMDIPYSEYNVLLKEFHKFIAAKILDGEMVELPAGCGILYIGGIKVKIRTDENGEVKGLAPDWPSTHKLWNSNPEAKKERRMVYHFNEHTKGVRYRTTWWVSSIPNISLYDFVFSRTNKREMAKRILNGKEYLIES